MNILGIDVGRTWGWFFSDDPEEHGEIKLTTLWRYYSDIVGLMLRFKPSVIICAYPVRYLAVVKLQSKLLAIIELLCEKNGVQFIEIRDATAKKIVLWKWNAKKDEVIKWSWIESEHCADAKLFVEYAKTLTK